MKQTYWLLLVIFAFSVSANSQAPSTDLERQRQAEQNRQRREEELDQRKQNMDMLLKDSMRQHQDALNRNHSRLQKPLSKEEKARIKQLIKPSERDLLQYKEFLRQPNTGIFRLFPDLDCVSEGILRVDGECANTVPEKWEYSFRLKDYADDIQFKNGSLRGNGFLSQEILTKLGDVPLENVTPASAAVKVLLGFKPAENLADAKKQFAGINKGIESDGSRYAGSVKAEENMSYAMRIIAYQIRVDGFSTPDDPRNTKPDDWQRFYSQSKNRIDLTLSFRIIGRDENGVLTILWKQINKQNAPTIVFSKNDKFSDIKPINTVK
ncbi:MAG: hypothetical protein ACR2L1_08465 [Pyrinomonadaceae bacterium]